MLSLQENFCFHKNKINILNELHLSYELKVPFRPVPQLYSFSRMASVVLHGPLFILFSSHELNDQKLFLDLNKIN